MNTKYYLPRNESDPYDNNLTVNAILEKLEGVSMTQVLAHGSSMINAESVWLEVGDDPVTGEGKRRYVTSQDVMGLDLPPSLFYFIACHSGHIFLDQNMEKYFPLAFIHSGSVAFIGPVTCQAICFWYKAPYGPAATQAVGFWENLLVKDMPVGTALANAKWDAYQEWFKDHPGDQRIEPDGPAFHLFGDPALDISGKAKADYAKKAIDLVISFDPIQPGEKFSVEVSARDLVTGDVLSVESITVMFNGVTQSGTTTTLTAPDSDSEQTITIEVTSEGYPDITAKFWVQVGTGDASDDGKDGDGGGFLAGFEGAVVAFAVLVAVAVVGIGKAKKK